MDSHTIWAPTLLTLNTQELKLTYVLKVDDEFYVWHQECICLVRLLYLAMSPEKILWPL